jgi:hypothetical protein
MHSSSRPGVAGNRRRTSAGPARSGRASASPAEIAALVEHHSVQVPTLGPFRCRPSSVDGGDAPDSVDRLSRPTFRQYSAEQYRHSPVCRNPALLPTSEQLVPRLVRRRDPRAWLDKPFYPTRPCRTSPHACATVIHFCPFADSNTASHTCCVRSASRKSGMAALPLATPSRKSATWWTKLCS